MGEGIGESILFLSYTQADMEERARTRAHTRAHTHSIDLLTQSQDISSGNFKGRESRGFFRMSEI